MTAVFEPDGQGPVSSAPSETQAVPGATQTEIPPPPIVSPDGMWIWTGQAWVPHPGAGPVASEPSQGTSGKAIASLVLGILWLWGIGSLIGLILGLVAKNDIDKRPRLGGRGMAVAGIILGIIGVVSSALITILVVAALSGSSSDGGGSDSSVKADLRNAATAEETYLTDNESYTADLSDLSDAGYKAASGTDLTILTDGARGFCLVGHRVGLAAYYLYDSAQGGLQSTPYASEYAAKSACSSY